MSRRRNTANLGALSSWFDLGMRTSQMLWSSAEVIGQRSQRMAVSGANPTAADQREMHRMVDEKMRAATESMQAMSSCAGKLYTRSLLRGDALGMAQAFTQMASVGLTPYHRRATENAKRLRKL